MPQRAGEERCLGLYGQLRAAILDRRLRPAARMPSSRNLAKQHGVSRGTVVAAFDHLRSEGYVEMRVGAGAFVATTIPTIPDEAIAVTKRKVGDTRKQRSEEHTSELQSRLHLVCRLLLEKKKTKKQQTILRHK